MLTRSLSTLYKQKIKYILCSLTCIWKRLCFVRKICQYTRISIARGALSLSHCFFFLKHVETGRETYPVTFSSPSPFSFLLVGGALARENEGLWRHRIFEFFDWLMENKEILSGSENVHASVFTGKEIKYDDGLPKKLCQPCFRKVKNIIEFRALSLATLSAQELLIGETRMKRVRGSQQVGESPSSSQHLIECSQCSDVPFWSFCGGRSTSRQKSPSV